MTAYKSVAFVDSICIPEEQREDHSKSEAGADAFLAELKKNSFVLILVVLIAFLLSLILMIVL